MFFPKHPPEYPLVMCEHFSDALVFHFVALELCPRETGTDIWPWKHYAGGENYLDN